MKRGKSAIILTSLVGLLLILQLTFVAAATVNLKVKAEGYEFHRTIIRVLNPSTNDIIETVYPEINATGYANTEFSSSLSEVSFSIFIKHPIDKEVVKQKDFEDEEISSNMELEVSSRVPLSGSEVSEPESVEDSAEEQSATETEQETEQETKNTPSQTTGQITGAVTDGNPRKTFDSKTFLYILGAIFILAGVLMFIVRKRKSKGPPHIAYENKPISEDVSPGGYESIEKELEDAGKEIKKAEEELKIMQDRKYKKLP
jgi:hypothetical protein